MMAGAATSQRTAAVPAKAPGAARLSLSVGPHQTPCRRDVDFWINDLWVTYATEKCTDRYNSQFKNNYFAEM